MKEEQLQVQNRNITDNNFGDHVTINQGDVHHHHAPKPPKPREPIRFIPYLRNKELVDRPDLVNKLHDLLPQTSESFNDAALWGLGGSGKTQIALEYAYRRCENPQCSVFWVHADTKSAFIHDYKKIAEMFGLKGILDDQESELLRAVSNRIQNEPQWLLVLDNADDLSLFGVGGAQEGSINLSDFIPKGTAVGTAGTALWTSRDGQIAGSLVHPSYRAIHVSHMTSMEARELLAIARGKDSDRDGHSDDDNEDKYVEKLLEELQWLPLAISQAGAYMRRAETTVQEYLGLLSNNEERWPLLKEEQFDLHRKAGVPNSILRIWSISVARIEQENALASELLHVMAYFDNRDIPQDMVDVAARSLSTAKVSSVEVKRAVIRLKEFSFIKLRKGENGSQSYEMHKLVQEATRYAISALEAMDEDDNSNPSTVCFAKVAIEVVDSLFPNLPKENVDGGGEKGEKILDMMKRGERYFAHAIQVAEWAEISKQEEMLCALLSRVSSHLRSNKRWKEKESVDTRSLTLHLRLFGPDHLDTIRCEGSIAENYCAQNRYSEAAEVEMKVFKNLKSSLGGQHIDVLIAMHNMADIMCKLFQFEEAEKLQAQAISLLENVVDERVGTLMAESLHCLARAYFGQRKFDKIGEVCVKSLMHCRDNLDGAGCPWYVAVADRTIKFKRQAMVVQGRRRSKESSTMKSLALEICKGIQRQTHLDEVSRTQLLARMKAVMGKHREAVAMQVSVMEHFRKTLGENHYKTIEKMHPVAILFHQVRQFDKAEALQLKVVKFFQHEIGEEHPHTLDCMTFLAAIYWSQGRTGESKEIQERVASIYSKILGRPFSMSFYRCNDMPTMVHFDDDNGEEAEMHRQVAAALTLLTSRSRWWIVVDICAMMGQIAAESMTTSPYRLLYIFCFFFSFVTLVLHADLFPKISGLPRPPSVTMYCY